jgi:hypothetical protein
MRPAGVITSLVAATAGLAVALAVSSAGAANQTVTLGSTSGTPSANICLATFDCTYVPFTNVSNPGLQVPFDGTVTSFSVNAASATGVVELRVLRPAAAGKYTGAGTGPPETLSLGVNTFTISLPVKAGDVLGLDNESSALMFDTSSASPLTPYYELPPLVDGTTAEPSHVQSGYRLLLSATVQSTSTTTTGTTPTRSTPTGTPPRLTNVKQSNRVWRVGKRLTSVSRRRKPPVGTIFSFSLNEQASVSFRFTRRVPGRKAGHTCVARTRRNRHGKSCKRTVTAGALSFAGHSGTNNVSFQGRISRSKRLKPGRYRLIIIATNAAGARSKPVSLSFMIVG